MFGIRSSSSNSLDSKQSALAILNNDRLTDAQKSAYAYDNGICRTCGIKTHWVGPFKRRPYTNERVWNGICRTCRPNECPKQDSQQQQSASTRSSSGPLGLGLMGKMAVTPDELLAKTTDAFKMLETGVKEGVKEGAAVMKAGAKEGAAVMKEGAAVVKGGIDTLNESIKKETEKINSNSSQLNIFGQASSSSSMSASSSQRQQSSQRGLQQPNQQQPAIGLPKINIFGQKRDNAPPKPLHQEHKTAFSNLGKSFQANPSEGKEELLLDEASNETAATEESVEDLEGDAVKGRIVKTQFGKGQVVNYRPEDDIYVIHLHHNNTGNNRANNATKLYCKKESFSIESESKSRQKRSMEINEAYESLEKMRRLNLEMECHERGVGVVDFDMCTVCLLHPELRQEQKGNFPRIRKLMQESQKKKAATPCLFCAAPCCAAHSNQAFRKENITACEECCKLFQSDYVVDCINQAHGVHTEKVAVVAEHGGDAMRERPLDHMMDLYDRVLLLLQYSSQYIESIAAALEQNTKTYNNVNVGASSTGMVSGALGVAAAAAIFTPAGPPLLVASLLLGGGATAVQTGTEVVNYFSEPNKFADKIIALVGMLHSLLRVKENLREILTARLLEQEGNANIDRLKKSLHKLKVKQRGNAIKAGTTVASTAVLGGVAIAEVAAAGAAVESAAIVSTLETGVLATRNANMLSKSGTAIARGARFARFAGGALSAATLVLEARTMSTTIEQIKAGHPCEKADALRKILKELPLLPTTEQLDEECRIYIGAMSNRVNATSLEDAINLIESKAIQEWQLTKSQSVDGDSSGGDLAPAGASILDGDDEGGEGDNDNDELAMWGSALREAQEQRSLAQSMSGLPPPSEVPTEIDANSVSDSVSVLSAPAQMSQSMTSLPSSTSPSASLSQSTLLERIQRFKREDSVASSGQSSVANN